jgi:hypothetical protein
MASNTIKLKKYVDTVIERVANAAITPGHLIELMSTNKFRKHATAGSTVLPRMFALEDELQGNGIDTDFSANDQVQGWITHPGEEVYAILAANQTIVINDKLESAGDGTLRKWTPLDSEASGHEYSVVGVALEAVTTTAAVARIKILIP